jgi:DNA replication licensing factor MCM7
MSLPVSNQFAVDYLTEKGSYISATVLTPAQQIFFLDKISNFLSTFASKETELTRGFADIGLNDDDDAPSRTKSLKYMQQLVRVCARVYVLQCLAHSVLAKNCKSRAGNADHRFRRYP